MTEPADCQYAQLPLPAGGMTHRYGDRVFLHSYPYPMSLLARLCSPATTQPLFNQIVAELYRFLLGEVASLELARSSVAQPTRMQPINPEAVYRGARIDPEQQVIMVDVARAGILPAQLFFDGLCTLLDPAFVRQDHVFMNRKTNRKGEVIGVDMSGSKIGGPTADRLVIVPDPMAATGSSMLAAMNLYRQREEGPPARFVAVHLIVTPEYIRRLTAEAPDVTIHAIRLDRGLSAPDVLAQMPGERDEERGLNAQDYIVPGAGGVGELINNALF